MSTSKICVVLLTVLAAGCSFDPSHRRSHDDDRLLSERDRYMKALKQEQRKIDWENRGPRNVEVPGHGTIILRDWRLLGLPHEEYMRVAFTYDNTTRSYFDTVRVIVRVQDAKGVTKAIEWVDLCIPLFGFSPGNTYTTQLRVPTRGAHWNPGWSWSIDCQGYRRNRTGSWLHAAGASVTDTRSSQSSDQPGHRSG